jgi:hypothetical protein
MFLNSFPGHVLDLFRGTFSGANLENEDLENEEPTIKVF